MAAPADRPAEERTDADRDFITVRVGRGLFFGVIGVLAGMLIGIFLGRATNNTASQRSDLSTSGQASPTPTIDVNVDPGRPSRGPQDAKVTLVEFTDYQCPFCRRHFNETYQRLIAAYEGRIRYVVLNFPIARIHPLAPKAAEAAECAHEQGKFWEYHDALFVHADALGVESLKKHAMDVGLDRGRFEHCLDSGAKTDVVRKDMEDGRRYGVSATPTFFINGEKVTGAKPFEVFRGIIEDKLDG